MSDSQPVLKFPPAYQASQRWARVLEIVRTICVDLGRGEVVEALDISPSRLDNALVERDRHHLKARDLLFFIAADRSEALIRELADLAGYELVPKREMTPEEELANLKAALSEELGPTVRQAVYDRARRR